ncbi:MAG: DUF1007 family protein [Paracoccaceae bacterium]|jgi:ABC-type uncharacterized transport system substrate-binding protein|nr:DUF1007 family protein [Paracoccaceae bacterium]
MIRPSLLATVLSLSPLAAAPAAAHPHIFVDVTHTLLFDAEGWLIGVRARWDYDEMFTLLMVEDGKYDTNGDGKIAGGELARFQHWDADWPADYGGDLEVTLDDQPLALAGPSDWAAEWHDGRAVSIHTRMLQTPAEVTGRALVILPYDPDIYVDYSVTAPPTFSGRDDCTAKVFEPDPDAIPEELATAIAELSPETTPEAAGLPAVGRLYADEERVQCGG